MNIYDISKEAGVSIATVSRVINGSANVNAHTKQKVISVIDAYGYTPNAFARGLGLNTMQTIGILCADSSDPYLAKAVYYIERLLKSNGYDSLLCCTGYELENKQKYLSLLLSKCVDSVILVGSNFVEAEDSLNSYIREAAKKVPVMVVSGEIDGENIYSTLSDDFHAIFDATTCLINSGITDILYLYRAKSFSGTRKLCGYREAFIQKKMPINEKLIQFYSSNEMKIHEIRDFLLSISKKGIEFDAVITSDDSLAIGALKYAKAMGLKVPENLSVIGYNNSSVSECCDPELTSIDNKLQSLCSCCVSTLLGVLSNKEHPKKTVFSAELIKRETTKF